MKNCPFCGNLIADDATFCGFCGNKIVTERAQTQVPPTASAQQTEKISISIDKNSTFVSPDEYVVATLKNGMMLNVLSGEGLKTEDAVLTNKRMYYNHSTGILNVHSQEEKVNIKDITGTKIASYNPLGILYLGILVLIAGIIFGVSMEEMVFVVPFVFAALFLILLYFFAKKSFLKIEYAGGDIRFSVKKYGKEKIRAFQKAIYAIKDEFEKQDK